MIIIKKSTYIDKRIMPYIVTDSKRAKFTLYIKGNRMELKDFINSVGPLPASSQKLLLKAFKQVRYPKGHCLLHEHSKSNKAYLTKQGIVHAYALKNGKSATFWMGQEGHVVYPAQHSKEGEYGTAELLEDCVLYEIDLELLHQLYQEDLQLANWGRIAAEKECMRLERSILSRQFKTTLQRYEELLNECPGIVQRVPVHIIASYLNTSPENLSRIRRRIR